MEEPSTQYVMSDSARETPSLIRYLKSGGHFGVWGMLYTGYFRLVELRERYSNSDSRVALISHYVIPLVHTKTFFRS